MCGVGRMVCGCVCVVLTYRRTGASRNESGRVHSGTRTSRVSHPLPLRARHVPPPAVTDRVTLIWLRLTRCVTTRETASRSIGVFLDGLRLPTNTRRSRTHAGKELSTPPQHRLMSNGRVHASALPFSCACVELQRCVRDAHCLRFVACDFEKIRRDWRMRLMHIVSM
jgi:hypothetical protein